MQPTSGTLSCKSYLDVGIKSIGYTKWSAQQTNLVIDRKAIISKQCGKENAKE